MNPQARAAAFAGRIFASLTLRLVLIGLVAALAFNTYGALSIKGPLGIGFAFEGWKPRAERLQRDLDNVTAAQEVALERALEAKHRAETKYLNLADRIDNEADQARAGALDDAERFIRANRVRCEAAGGSSSGTVAAAEDHSAQGSDRSSPAPELVAVTEDDVRVCTVNTTRLEAVREWALELEKAE